MLQMMKCMLANFLAANTTIHLIILHKISVSFESQVDDGLVHLASKIV